MFKNLTKSEKSWVLYDVGNSAFTMLACSMIPIWFKELAIGTAPGASCSTRPRPQTRVILLNQLCIPTPELMPPQDRSVLKRERFVSRGAARRERQRHS